jgi:deazaflavin-dependent oxidoreductase (nitroreductase family)
MPATLWGALRSIRSRLHRWIFTATHGRVLGRWGGLPVVQLTTTGRRTGRRRVTMLASPLQEGDRIVLVASNGGAPRHPDWYLNLRDGPDVEVMMRGRRGPMRARTATPDEQTRLWPLVTNGSPSYGRYRARTTRAIPIVVLEPRPTD